MQYCQNDNVPLALTRDEKSAVNHLLTSVVESNNGNGDDINADDEVDELDEIEQVRKQRRTQEIGSSTAHDYINLDFILGSAAEVERLWNVSSYILLKHHL